jgi:uncharacterized protein YbjT (DUF2867 family)
LSAATEEAPSPAGPRVLGAGAPRSAIVTGASGLVGCYLLPMLVERGFVVQAISRRPEPPPGAGLAGAVRWTAMDLDRPTAIDRADCLIHAAPIWLLPGLLRTADAVRRLVAVSSTSRFTKESSRNAKERETARRLAEAERLVESLSRERGTRWTILRPTLVYGGGRDRNVSDIARFISRFGFFPIAGPGSGRRQPVHGADLAAACVAVLDNPATFDRSYDVPGGETLTYVEMVARVAWGMGRTPRLVHLPPSLLRLALGVASRFPGLGHLTPDMADRMNEDLEFDTGAARRDFAYNPRPFEFPGEVPPRRPGEP